VAICALHKLPHFLSRICIGEVFNILLFSLEEVYTWARDFIIEHCSLQLHFFRGNTMFGTLKHWRIVAPIILVCSLLLMVVPSALAASPHITYLILEIAVTLVWKTIYQHPLPVKLPRLSTF
jgi:hypothetical protein